VNKIELISGDDAITDVLLNSFKFDELVKSPKTVIPAKAGIHK
jgi:hypothetical protein